MIRVLFVCLGNICRSPMAEGIFADLVKQAGLDAQFQIDSAGTGNWHQGQAPDSRAQETMQRHHKPIDHLRARQITTSDLEHFDYILVMDQQNKSNVQELLNQLECNATQRENYRQKIHLMLDTHPQLKGQSVPDPYFGEDDGFEKVYTMLKISSQNLLKQICAEHALIPS